ncbi:MAG: hypothetical protein ACYTBX_02770 [Planctomycetota bacterium]
MMFKVRARQVYCLVFVVFCILFAGRSAWATSTGLNNIPTTDIVPENILVFQTWGNFAGGELPQEFIGFKYGPYKDVEIGIDWKANDRPHGHAMLQAKYAFDIGSDALRGVIGIADLSDNRKHNGEYFPYAATSLDLEAFRLHFGFAPQPHNEAFFGGFDKTVSFLDRNLQLRFDGIHINDMKDMKFSAGFLYDFAPKTKTSKTQQTALMEFLGNLTKNMLIESWVTMPSTGDKQTYTIKLNYVIRF